MTTKGTRECEICKKVVSGSNFSRHSKLHFYCELCGTWSWKNRHICIYAPVFRDGHNMVQIWVPHLVPYHSIQNYLTNVTVEPTPPPQQPDVAVSAVEPTPETDFEKFFSEYFDA